MMDMEEIPQIALKARLLKWNKITDIAIADALIQKEMNKRYPRRGVSKEKEEEAQQRGIWTASQCNYSSRGTREEEEIGMDTGIT